MNTGRQAARDAVAAIGAGDWETAHGIVQAHEGDPDCDRVHAHLHRREGDVANARYWYRRAGRDLPAASVQDEMAAIAGDLSAAG